MKSETQMFEKIEKTIRVQYKNGKYIRIAIRAGIVVIVVLILLCYIEVKKEAVATVYYEKTLYEATAQGRWVKYGQYEPDTLYQKTLNGMPVLHYMRMNALKGEKESGESSEKSNKDQEQNNEKLYQSEDFSAKVKEENVKKEKQGSLLVRYAYGTLQPLEDNTMESEQTGKADTWTVESDTRKTLDTILATVKEQYRWKEFAEKTRFLKNYYIADVSVGEVSSVINGEKLLTMDTSLKHVTEEPQILVYHTHGTEKYRDSREGVEADTVVGMGDVLCEVLTAKGFSVLHDRTTYDFVNGKDNRDYAYTTARPQIEALLKEYPSIEVVLDIHRDSGAARRTVIEGHDTAQIMLFNGLCRNASGPIKNLSNPYLDDTLAFSLQLNLLGRERRPGLMYKIYLKNYRYNMHFNGHCMLVELGTEQNTVEEAKNGVRYFAELLYELLTEKRAN